VLVSFGRIIRKHSVLFEKDYGQGLARTLLFTQEWIEASGTRKA